MSICVLCVLYTYLSNMFDICLVTTGSWYSYVHLFFVYLFDLSDMK